MLYEELGPKQKALVDDWIHRYGAMRSEKLAPNVYDESPLSVKTTFAAVTNAIGSTALTDDGGKPIANEKGEPMTALDLVAKLDAVHGKKKGASGDEQFRIYVQLVPDAVSILEESREFSRRADNTIYHKGYPQNFRSTGGTPSIQYSIAANGTVADIDVDYRSSKFPAALVNGHLSAANSDVRAGNNYDRHLQHWKGLENWWNGWEGLGDWFAALYGARGLDIPEKGKKAGGSIEEAVHDFLHSWLIEREPNQAMSYFSKDIYKCFGSVAADEDSKASPEQRMYRKMSEAVRVIGNPRDLASVVQGVNLTGLSLPAIQGNPYHSEFVLYELPPERALEFECGFNELSIPKARRAQMARSGEYVLGTFFLKSGELRGVTSAVLWHRESDGWKMVSFELEPVLDLVPDLHAPPVVPVARGGDDVARDPDVARASDELMTTWFVKKDYEAAGFFSTDSYRCMDLFGDEREKGSDPRAPFVAGLRAVSDFLGDVERGSLSEAMERVEPWDPSFRDVTPESSAASLVAISDDAVGFEADFSEMSQAGSVSAALAVIREW
jgi:hypothetical protein